MRKYSILHYFAKNKDIKCAIIERFNKTLKNKMFHYFTLAGNRKFIDILPELITSYNNSYHRSIKMSPNQVTRDNAKQVFRNLYGYESVREMLRSVRKPTLKPETTVRKKYDLKVHNRGYYPNWTDQVYKIYKAMPGLKRPYYRIKDEQGNEIERRFYSTEIQPIKNDLHRVERIIKEKTVRGQKQYYVKWLNYPDSHNSWIPASNITAING